jgi:hypothetical protein
MLFDWIHKITGEKVQWAYLYGTGMIGVTADMNGKQMNGKYIATLEESVPTNR